MSDDDNACVRNIVKEIMRECFPRKIKVNKNFVTYLTKLLLMDPNWGINENFFFQRENVQLFVQYIIQELLKKQEQPIVVTLKIQFYFTCNLKNLDLIIDMDKKAIRDRLARLKDDILDLTQVNDKEEMDKLYKKISYYITLVSGLGNPTLSKVYDEVSVTLKSIVNEDEMKSFVSSSKNAKAESIEEFIRVAAGIRLFNKDCDRGGEGIENLPEMLHKAVGVIKSGAQQILLTIMDRVNTLTTIIDRCYVIKNTFRGNQVLLDIPQEFANVLTSMDIQRVMDMLIFYRQYELLTRRMLEQIDLLVDRKETICSQMKKLLAKIHDTVRMRIAIPVNVVFPLFEQLWEIWSQLQDQAMLLSRFSQVIINLEVYSKEISFDFYFIEQLIGEEGAQTDAQRLEKTAHLKITSDNPELEVFSIENFKNIDAVDLEYLGFCCWKLIETNGALIPGNPNMGIARYNGKNFVFSCPEACEIFSRNPSNYINHLLDLARKKPQLINFLRLQEQLETVYGVEKLVQETVEVKMCSENEVQTDLHVPETYIDPNYKWNIWDLKREALLMANISKCKTVSTQTDKTSSKNSVRTQTYTKKVVNYQTTQENHTNTPTPSNFIYGLRGRKDAEQFIIDLTRPVDE